MQNEWFVELNAVLRPRATVVCFPFAGGNALSFRHWKRHVPGDVLLAGVDLPGRGMRFGEPLLERVDAVVAALLGERAWLQRHAPFVFFGHSLGALLAFEFTRALEGAGGPLPVHLVVSGRAAPHLPRGNPPIHALPDDRFVQELAKYEGTPADILANEEVLDVFLPALRADFAVSETYRPAIDAVPLRTAVTALGGQRDGMVNASELPAWREHTRGEFASHVYEGGHFFIDEHTADIVRRLVDCASGARRVVA